MAGCSRERAVSRVVQFAQARSEEGAYSKKSVTDEQRSISASQPKDDGKCILKTHPSFLLFNPSAFLRFLRIFAAIPGLPVQFVRTGCPSPA
jgi:hypothetical protein